MDGWMDGQTDGRTYERCVCRRARGYIHTHIDTKGGDAHRVVRQAACEAPATNHHVYTAGSRHRVDRYRAPSRRASPPWRHFTTCEKRFLFSPFFFSLVDCFPYVFARYSLLQNTKLIANKLIASQIFSTKQNTALRCKIFEEYLVRK